MYQSPTFRTIRFLASKRGYEYFKRLINDYYEIFPPNEIRALEIALERFDRWRVLVYATYHRFDEIQLIMIDAKLTGINIESILDTIRTPEVNAIIQLAGRAEYCRRACQDASDYNLCFIRCMRKA